MKSHLVLLQEVLADASAWCCTSTTKDLNRILSRIEHEGDSFLTITLPDFGKTFEQCLDLGRVRASDFPGWAKSGYLPKLFSGFTSLVFDRKSGYLLDDPDETAIHSVRQLTLLFGKVLLPCSDTRLEAAFSKYVETDSDVATFDQLYDPFTRERFREMAWKLFGEHVLVPLDRKVYEGDIVPKHGPGATADRVFGNQKYNHRVWTERLEELFPCGEFLFPSWSHYASSDGPRTVTWEQPGTETPTRVVAVPKTLKTPRIIGIEPVCNQFVQQGIAEPLVNLLEDYDNPHSSFIGFRSQVPNQEFARTGSIDGTLATLDLSEASDRVSNLHVMDLFDRAPTALAGIQACRSMKADVPGHGVISLSKFASMGSALCFPVEAMVFLTVIFLGIQKDKGNPLTPGDILSYRGKVRVYGDDIVIPVEHVRSVTQLLESYGFVVNRHKSFWTGKFRESCGKEYYNGSDVSIVKVRRMLPESRRHVEEIVSAVSLRNQLYKIGYWRAAAYLDHVLSEFIPMPRVWEESPGLGRHTFLDHQVDRVCPNLQRPLVRAAVVKSDPPKDPLEGPGALLKFFLKRGDEPSADKRHLERAGRPKAVNIKLGFVPPY